MPVPKIISVKGAIDLHVHTGPSLFLRPFDDVETARRAAEAGISAIWLKDHYESTIGRAYHTCKQVPEVKALGGIVLNRYIGGLNPAAVEYSLLMGSKLVMMPTIDAAHHAKIFGKTGSYQLKGRTTGARTAFESSRMNEEKGISVLKNGKLTEETKEILDLLAKFNSVLGTGHLSKEEVVEIAIYAKSINYNKVLITHVDFDPVCVYSINELEYLINEFKIFIEFTASTVYNPECEVTFEKLKQMMDKLDINHCVISTDVGAPQFPIECEALRMYVQQLYEYGVSEEFLKKMMIDNPKYLIGNL